MTNILRIFDFYGTEFHWYFDYKPKYYTSYGGIFSIYLLFYTLLFSLYLDWKILNELIPFHQFLIFLLWLIKQYNQESKNYIYLGE